MISEATGCLISVCDHRNPGEYTQFDCREPLGFCNHVLSLAVSWSCGASGRRLVCCFVANKHHREVLLKTQIENEQVYIYSWLLYLGWSGAVCKLPYFFYFFYVLLIRPCKGWLDKPEAEYCTNKQINAAGILPLCPPQDKHGLLPHLTIRPGELRRCISYCRTVDWAVGTAKRGAL